MWVKADQGYGEWVKLILVTKGEGLLFLSSVFFFPLCVFLLLALNWFSPRGSTSASAAFSSWSCLSSLI